VPLLCALLLLATATGCKDDGQLVLELDLPASNAGLDPMEDERLDHFTLTVHDAAGGVETINTVPYEPGRRSLDIGQVPVGALGDLRLVGYSATNQVLAWAETGALTTRQSSAVSVSLALRKPFTYIAGGGEIVGFDTARSEVDTVATTIPLGGGVSTDIAATPDGRFLLVSVAGFENPPAVAPSLKLYTTAAHQPGKEIPLAFKPGHISLSPDGAWAVVAQYREEGEDAQHVAVVDMQRALNAADPSTAARIVNMQNASRVAFVTDRSGEPLAVILRDQLDASLDCEDPARDSQLSTIRLSDGTLVDTADTLGMKIRDITSDPADHRVFVADTCSDRVAVFDVDDQSVTGFPWTITRPYSLIVSDRRLYVGGLHTTPGATEEAARIEVTVFDPWDDLSNANVRTLSVPFPSEAVVVVTLGNDPGVRLLVDIVPQDVRVYRLSVPPGENRLSALVRAEYHASSFQIQGESVTLTIPALDITSESYIGLDSGSAAIRRRYRAYCIAYAQNPAPDPPTPLFCKPLDPHEQHEDEFRPRGATSIYGVP